MRFTAKQYAQSLMAALEGVSPKDEVLVLDNFVKVLAENNDVGLFEKIAEEFHKQELGKKGIRQLEITSAHTISRENEQQIIHELNKLVKADFEVKKQVDEKLVGGIVIRMDDQMLDASVKNDLEQLKKNLIQ